jgi:hypothetical protein
MISCQLSQHALQHFMGGQPEAVGAKGDREHIDMAAETPSASCCSWTSKRTVECVSCSKPGECTSQPAWALAVKNNVSAKKTA